jgi:hypothetical protein
MRNPVVKSVFRYLNFIRSYKHLQVRPYWIQVEHFKWEGGNVIHVLGLEFDEEQNGEVCFQISSFLKKLQACITLPLESNMAAYKMAAVKVTPPNDFPLGLIRSHMIVIHLFLMLCDKQRVVRDLCPILYVTCPI